MVDRLIWCVAYTFCVLKHDIYPFFTIPPSELVTPITSTILTGVCKCGVWNTSLTLSRKLWVYLRDPGHHFRCQVSWVFELLGPMSSSFLTFWISRLPLLIALMDWILFLSWGWNCAGALVCPVAVETQRDSSPGDYTLPPVIESSSPRSEILSPYEQRARYSPPSRES